MGDLDKIEQRFQAAKVYLDEQGRRIFAASEARSMGYGGIRAVSKATGIAPSTIGRGLKDLDDPTSIPSDRMRRKGSGRPSLTQSSPAVLEDLRKLVEPHTMGDPMRPLVWISKSLAKLSDALGERGYNICPNTVRKLLKELDFSRQGNRKAEEGSTHPDRDAQFNHISNTASDFISAGNPVISVDTKKKELIGDFKNPGTDYRPKGCPDRVRTHDFMDKQLGKAIPHGVYDVAANAGWVTVGIDNDTAQFGVNSIRYWWDRMGSIRYPNAEKIMITADGGGSNGSRLRLWKRELQEFANETGLSVTVSHFPPGTSKWNKIEHRLFCHITQNWRGQPLITHQVVVDLIGSTKTKTGLVVQCELDKRTYPKGIEVTMEEISRLNIQRDEFHPEWNYTISPQIFDD
jgi:hypothetical protein